MCSIVQMVLSVRDTEGAEVLCAFETARKGFDTWITWGPDQVKKLIVETVYSPGHGYKRLNNFGGFRYGQARLDRR